MLHLKHSTEYTKASLPESPRRGEPVAIAKSLLRFRIEEPSCFCLDAIAGALLVITQCNPVPLVLPPNPDLHHRICSAFQSRPSSSHLHPCSSYTAIRSRRTPIKTPPRGSNSLYQQRSAGNSPAVYRSPRRHSCVCIICGPTATSDMSTVNVKPPCPP